MGFFNQPGQSCDPTGSVCHPNCDEWMTSLRLYPCIPEGRYRDIYVESCIAGFGHDRVCRPILRNMLHSCDVYDNSADEEVVYVEAKIHCAHIRVQLIHCCLVQDSCIIVVEMSTNETPPHCKYYHR